MIKVSDQTMCTGCTVCAVSCPVKCIQMTKDAEGFLYPFVDEQKCIHCDLCEKKCPVINQISTEPFAGAEAYAAKSLDEEIRMQSSSGGIFSELADWVIQHGGVVFGASLNEKFLVEHICVEKEENLKKLRGSKYLQSSIGQSYEAVKRCLNHNQWVLFTGTPCQIAGLYSFLGKDYANLITQDVICHGVPSPRIWEHYLTYQSKRNENEKIKHVNFRDKSTGWKNYSLTIKYEGSKVCSKLASKDWMMKAFLKNLCLRPSCYECVFKQFIKQSDITLADFWGIDLILPDWDDDKGVSLVLLNSQKGKILFSEIQSKITYTAIDRGDALKYNPSAVKSSPRPSTREAFMFLTESKGFRYAAKKYLNTSIINRMVMKFMNVLHNLM